MCEQLTSYLNKFMSAAEAVVTNISVDARTAELEGLKVFKKADIEVGTFQAQSYLASLLS